MSGLVALLGSIFTCCIKTEPMAASCSPAKFSNTGIFMNELETHSLL